MAFLPLVVMEVVSNGKESTYSVLQGGLCLKIIAASARCRSASGLIRAALTQKSLAALELALPVLPALMIRHAVLHISKLADVDQPLKANRAFAGVVDARINPINPRLRRQAADFRFAPVTIEFESVRFRSHGLIILLSGGGGPPVMRSADMRISVLPYSGGPRRESRSRSPSFGDCAGTGRAGSGVLRQSADTTIKGRVTEAVQTFGKYIGEVRKQLGMSQKQLAERIEREEGGSISPQYLNDIEHDRRSPSSDHMIQQFARVLNVSADYLYYLAGRIPADIRQANMPPNEVERMASVFRRTNPPKQKG